MYDDRDSKREELVSRVRQSAGNPEQFIASCIRVLHYDAEYQKVWNPATARDAYLRLTDILIEYFEKKAPRQPWKN